MRVMKKDTEVKVYMQERRKGRSQRVAAARAGISERTARSIPYLVFSLPVGALIDRWDRKRVMILCDTGRAVALGSVAVVYLVFGTVSMAQLYLVALVEGSLFVFFNIAEVACLPRVVTKEH